MAHPIRGPSRINVPAFINLMRAIYERNKSRTALLGIVMICQNMVEKMHEIRELLKRRGSLDTLLRYRWDDHFRDMRTDLQTMAENLQVTQEQSDIPLDELRDQIANVLLYGHHEAWWDPEPWYRTTPYVAAVAIQYNQIIEALRIDIELYSQYPPQWAALGEFLTITEKQLSSAAPGEDPTVLDNVKEAIKAAAEAVAEIMKEIGKAALPWALGVLGLGLGGLLLYRWAGRTTVKVST